MSAYVLLQGSARHLPLADESVHACVTSIPFWGLRAYGTEPQVWGGGKGCAHCWGEWEECHAEREETVTGKTRTTERFYGEESRKFNGNHQKHTAGAFCSLCGAWRGELGLEPDPCTFVAHIVEVFREVRRVLRRDGVLWLNIGDSYASAPNGRSAAATKEAGNDDRTFRDKPFGTATGGLKAKDLVMMPARVALALQADGWWIRSDCIWAKKNPLPSSVKDRPAMSHEYVFMLTKAERYYYDNVAVREKQSQNPVNLARRLRTDNGAPGHKTLHGTEWGQSGKGARNVTGDRNLRSVWSLATQPLSAKRFGADVEHFAAFPEALVKPCILAAPERVCAGCSAPWERVTQPGEEYARHFGANEGADGDRNGKGYRKHSPAVSADYRTVAWRPTCRCQRPERLETKPAVILDPFCGSATVGVVALRHNRDFIGIDLSHAYLSGLAAKRIAHSRNTPARKPRVARLPKPEQLTLPGTLALFKEDLP